MTVAVFGIPLFLDTAPSRRNSGVTNNDIVHLISDKMVSKKVHKHKNKQYHNEKIQ